MYRTIIEEGVIKQTSEAKPRSSFPLTLTHGVYQYQYQYVGDT